MAELLELTRGTAGVLSMSTGDEGDGRNTVFLTAPDGTTRKRRCSYEEFDSMMGTLEREGERGVAAFFSNAEPVTVSGLEREVLMLAAGRCLGPDGFVDEERVARFARERNLSYTEARDLVTAALNGDEGDDRAERAEYGFTLSDAEERSRKRSIPLSQAIVELTEEAPGGSVGDGDRDAASGGDELPVEAEIDHEHIVAELSARNLDMTHYADVAFELAAAEDRRI